MNHAPLSRVSRKNGGKFCHFFPVLRETKINIGIESANVARGDAQRLVTSMLSAMLVVGDNMD